MAVSLSWGMAVSTLLVLILAILSPSTGKTIVLGGGNMAPGNDAFYGKVVELAGGQGVAKIGIITAANRRPEDNYNYYSDIFKQYGVLESPWIPIHQDNKSANSDPNVVSMIRSMTGFFFGGGNRGRLVSCFYNEGREASPALTAIREVYTAGRVVSGVSAGMVSQTANPMILLGESWNALRYGACETNQICNTDDLEYDQEGGLAMYEGYVLDSHFMERGREGRLIRMIADTMAIPKGVKFGFGVDEDTALVVTNVGEDNEEGELIGRSGAFFADLTSSSVDDTGLYWSIDKVKGHYLTTGDKINLKSRAATIAPWKQTIRGNEIYEFASTSDKIFNGNYENPTEPSEFVRVGTSLVDCTGSNETFGDSQTPSPYFRVTFSLTSSTAGYVGLSPETGTRVVSYTDMEFQVGERS